MAYHQPISLPLYLTFMLSFNLHTLLLSHYLSNNIGGSDSHRCLLLPSLFPSSSSPTFHVLCFLSCFIFLFSAFILHFSICFFCFGSLLLSSCQQSSLLARSVKHVLL
ncbi:hypothetical protein AAHE18_05G066900 [Arachis hypogaea]